MLSVRGYGIMSDLFNLFTTIVNNNLHTLFISTGLDWLKFATFWRDKIFMSYNPNIFVPKSSSIRDELLNLTRTKRLVNSKTTAPK